MLICEENVKACSNSRDFESKVIRFVLEGRPNDPDKTMVEHFEL